MRRWIPLCLALVASAGLVWAAQTINVNDVYVFQTLFRPHVRSNTSLPSASAYMGYMAFNSTNSDLTVSDGTNWRTASPLIGSFAWDFPALGSATGERTCSETAAFTVTGAALGMGCSPSSNLGLDGGGLLLTEADLSCNVTATNAAKVKLCVRFTDGGTYDLGDAGFFARVFN